MGSAFGFSQACLHRQMWRLLQMQLAPWDLVLTSRMSGSVGRGASPSPINQSLLKSFFRLWLLRTCGARDGTDAMSCSALTTRLWCTSLHPGRQKFSALCNFCAINSLRQPNVVLPFLLFTYLAFTTQLLTLSPVSIGRSSGIWRPRLYHIQHQFLNSCGIF